MPFDAFLTRALAHELSVSLTGMKVDRVNQPERDEIDLLFNAGGKTRLVINCLASSPYMALSRLPKENPAAPPMMCMLLRKHLSRARVTQIAQEGFDRTIRLTFDAGDEMGFRRKKHLYCEMMGRGSNMVFVDEDGTILAAFRQNDLTTKFDRVVMVGMPYKPMPPLDKTDPASCEKGDFCVLFSGAEKELSLSKWYQTRFAGIGKLTAAELAYRASGRADALMTDTSAEKAFDVLKEALAIVSEGVEKPCLIYPAGEEAPVDFSCLSVTCCGEDFRVEPCESVSDAVERYYLQKERAERKKQHYNDIFQILKTCRNRLEKKIAAQVIQLQDAGEAELYRKKGDLIIQELYRVRQGDTRLIAPDYEKDPPEMVEIELSEMLSPSRNAQRYYKTYAKMKAASVKVQEQIDIAKNELAYVESVLATLETAETATDLEQIRRELSHWGYGRRLASGLKKPSTRETKAKPRSYRTPGGSVIWVGMNHLQNETVTFDIADKDDLWFHVKRYHGSHVLLKRGDADFDPADVEIAAGLAAYYSEARSSPKAEVDYTRARYVKKPAGAKPGFVIYRNEKTALVEPKRPDALSS